MDSDRGCLSLPRSIHCRNSEVVLSVSTETFQLIGQSGRGHYHTASRVVCGAGDIVACDDTIRTKGRSPQ